jgi:hypothetical protein
MSDEDAGPSGSTAAAAAGQSNSASEFLLDDKIGVIGAGQVRTLLVESVMPTC